MSNDAPKLTPLTPLPPLPPPERAPLRPLFTLAGSKRSAAPALAEKFPKEIHSWIEPFAGSAAMLCYMATHHPSWTSPLIRDGEPVYPSVGLFDGDPDLWGLYATLFDRRTAEALLIEARKIVAGWDESPPAYIASVREWNTSLRPRNPALQLALRTHTFNGVWRNSKRTGLNVPPANRLDGVRLPTTVDVNAWVDLIRASSAFYVGTWDVAKYDGTPDSCIPLEAYPMSLDQWPYSGRAVDSLKFACARAQTNIRGSNSRSVIYLDPPYVGKFVGYLPNGFNEDAQIRTLRFARDLAQAGHFVAWSNSNCAEARELVRAHWPEAQVDQVVVPRSVAADRLARVDAPELLAYGFGT